MDWSSDAVNGFGFICNSGKAKVSDLSPALCPSLLLGKEGDLAILEDVRADTIYHIRWKGAQKTKAYKARVQRMVFRKAPFCTTRT